MGWSFGRRRDEWEPYDPRQDESNEFGVFPDDDGTCFCGGDDDLPCFPKSESEARFTLTMFLLMQVAFVVTASLGVLLIWAPLLGTSLGTVLALLGTAWFAVVFQGLRSRAVDWFYWGSVGLEAEFEFLLQEIAE